MPEIGDELRAVREARHLSLSEISEQLHIRTVYLEALENEQWAVIGAPVYVRGFLRHYARFLGIDPQPMVDYYNATLPRSGALAANPERSRSLSRTHRRGPSAWIWLGAIAAAALVAFVGYNYSQFRPAAKSAIVAAPIAASPEVRQSAEARESGAAQAAMIPSSPVRTRAPRTLELRLTERAWLLVHIDGAKRLEGTFPPGTRRAYHGRLADIRTGNAGGVVLRVNGREIGTMGHNGAVLERSIALDEE